MRSGNRVLAALVAAVLAATGVIALLEIVAAAGGRDTVVVDWPAWVSHLADWSWSSGAVRLIGVLAVLAGLVVLVLGARLAAPARFRARTTSATVASFVSYRALARALKDTALTVDGITGAAVRVRRRRAVVRARVRARTSPGAGEETRRRLARRLESFDLVRPPRLALRLAPARRHGHRDRDPLVPGTPPPSTQTHPPPVEPHRPPVEPDTQPVEPHAPSAEPHTVPVVSGFGGARGSDR